MRRCILLLLGVMLTGVLSARPFDPGLVSAKTKWFIHADLEEFKKTDLGKFALRQLKQVGKELRPLELMLRLDLQKDLHAITLYGIGTEKTEAVLMLHGKFDRQQITAIAKTAREHRAIELRGHVIHGWEDKEGAHYGCLVKGHTVLFSDGLQTLREAINVLDQETAGLKPKAIVTKATAGGHPFFLMGLVDFEALGELDADAKILEKMKALCFAIGQADKNLQGRLLVQPRDKKTGGQILQIIKGMIAMVEIAPDENNPELRELKKLAENLKIEMTEPFIALNLKMPAKSIVDALRASLDFAGPPSEGNIEINPNRGGDKD